MGIGRFAAIAASCGILAGCASAATGPSSAAPAEALPSTSVPSPTEPSMRPGEPMRWTVGPALVDCVGVAPTWCLLYRDAPDGPWKRLYGSIQGFRFTPGDEVDLLVRAVDVPRPPADAPSRRYVMDREIERRTITSTTLPPALAGTEWTLVAMPGAASVSGPRGPLTLSFDAAGRAAGHSGVNRYGARVDAGPAWLRVSQPMVTRMAGPPEAMQLEADFLARLQRAGGWRIDRDRLRLIDATGGELMTLQRAPAR
jgi:heat shock protein HslJ